MTIGALLDSLATELDGPNVPPARATLPIGYIS